jgi:hypothetical protein
LHLRELFHRRPLCPAWTILAPAACSSAQAEQYAADGSRIGFGEISLVCWRPKDFHRQSAPMAAAQNGERSPISPRNEEGWDGAFPRQSPFANLELCRPDSTGGQPQRATPRLAAVAALAALAALPAPAAMAALPAPAALVALGALAAADRRIRLSSRNRRASVGCLSIGIRRGQRRRIEAGRRRGARTCGVVRVAAEGISRPVRSPGQGECAREWCPGHQGYDLPHSQGISEIYPPSGKPSARWRRHDGWRAT